MLTRSRKSSVGFEGLSSAKVRESPTDSLPADLPFEFTALRSDLRMRAAFLFRVLYGLLWDELEELFWPHFESGGDLHDAVELDVRFGPLDPSDEVPMNGTHLRELLLGEMLGNSQFPYSPAEQL
jgi:hypothetical protein